MGAYQPNNILITGGAGFIGSNFIRYVLADPTPIKVINLDALTYAGSLENLLDLPNPDAHTFIKGNICDSALVEEILNKYHIDTVINFAAESHVDRSIADPTLFIDTNITGTYRLLASAHRYWLKQFSLSPERCRFYHLSTDEVFGSVPCEEAPRKETDRYQPSSPYAASKAAADQLLQAYHKTYQVPIVVGCASNNYGPRQHGEKFIPTVIACCVNKKNIPIYGDGKHSRDWLHVDDHCAAIQAVLHKGLVGQHYHIASGNEISNNALAKIICGIMDKMIPVDTAYQSLMTPVKDRLGHDFRYALNTDKTKSQLGWTPKINLIEGLTQTVKFYLKKIGAHIDHTVL